MHGGLFSKDEVTLEDIRKVDRFRQPSDEGVLCVCVRVCIVCVFVRLYVCIIILLNHMRT